MRLFNFNTLRTYGEANADAAMPLKAWYDVARRAEWTTPQAIRDQYGNASFVANNRVVFNIGGNKYRLVVAMDYAANDGFVKFIGTHIEYDAIDVETVEF